MADKSVADQLRELGVKDSNVLVRMAERGQLLALRCEMPQCYHHQGRGAFDPVGTPGDKWSPRATTTRGSDRMAVGSSPRTFDSPTLGATSGTGAGGRKSGRSSRRESPSPTSPSS
jgi:hypothetical protein